jgi:hypothetical protein
MTATADLKADLSFVQGDETWKSLRKRAVENLYWFNSTVLGFAEVFPLEEITHLVPHLFMQRKTGAAILDEAQYQLLMWPRETGKSTCGTVGYAIWRAVQNPEIAILIANESAKLASDFVQAIEHHFEHNAFLQALFPECKPDKDSWSATRARLMRTSGRQDPTFDSIGVGGTVTGYHPDLIICDDIISQEAFENAKAGAWSVVERVNRWVNRLEMLLSSSAKPFPEIRFIGTRWFEGDSYEHIEKAFGHDESPTRVRIKAKLSDGQKISREAYRVGDLAILKIAGIEDGEAVFPKIWPMERMAKVRMNDPELFSCNIMNDPVRAEIRTFQDPWLRWWNWIDKNVIAYRKQDGHMRYVKVEDLHRIMVVDPAFTATGDGSRAAIVVTGTDQTTGANLVLDVYAERVVPTDLVADVLNMAHRWRVTRVFIEAIGQQAAFISYVETEARRKNQPVAIETVKPGGRNKDVRIESLSAYFKNCQIYCHPEQHALLEEYRSFRPGSRYKDVLDALAYAAEKWPRYAGDSGMDAKKRSQLQLQSYRARRGLR